MDGADLHSHAWLTTARGLRIVVVRDWTAAISQSRCLQEVIAPMFFEYSMDSRSRCQNDVFLRCAWMLGSLAHCCIAAEQAAGSEKGKVVASLRYHSSSRRGCFKVCLLELYRHLANRQSLNLASTDAEQPANHGKRLVDVSTQSGSHPVMLDMPKKTSDARARARSATGVIEVFDRHDNDSAARAWAGSFRSRVIEDLHYHLQRLDDNIHVLDEDLKSTPDGMHDEVMELHLFREALHDRTFDMLNERCHQVHRRMRVHMQMQHNYTNTGRKFRDLFRAMEVRELADLHARLLVLDDSIHVLDEHMESGPDGMHDEVRELHLLRAALDDRTLGLLGEVRVLADFIVPQRGSPAVHLSTG